MVHLAEFLEGERRFRAGAAHWAQADAGAAWVVDYQHQAQKLIVLTGEDMPWRFERIGMRDHIASPNHVEVTLTLKG